MEEAALDNRRYNVCTNNMSTLKLIKIGNSVGAIFSKELLTRLGANEGDSVHITDAPDGLRLTPYDPEFAEQMELVGQIMKRRRNALRELAK